MKKATTRSTLAIVAVDIVVLGIYWFIIPELKRPFEGLMLVVIVLAALTALFSRPAWMRTVSAMVVALALAVFGLEMGQKFFGIVDIFEKKQELAQGTLSRYSYDGQVTASYFAAMDRALADGIDPATFNTDFAGDIFRDVPKDKLRIRESHRGDRLEQMISIGESSPYLRDSPLGVELRPSSRIREVAHGMNDPRTIWDGAATITEYGTRYVRGNDDSPDAYLFMGCSMMFGMNLSDDQTAAHYFNEAFGFDKRIINTAIGGNGPHHSLRDLELNLRPGRAGVRDSQVRGVFFWLIGHHALRVNSVFPPGSPRYEIENGRAVYKGTFADVKEMGRLHIMMSRSRIYPLLRDKLQRKTELGDIGLVHAIIEEMNRICQERYGVPLTVFTWDVKPGTDQALRDMGVRLVTAADVYGEDWTEKAVLYRLPDSHATVYANRLLGRYLHDLEMRETQP